MNSRPKRTVKLPVNLKEYDVEENDWEGSLGENVNISKSNIFTDNGTPPYECKKCHIKYDDRKEFILHIRKHRGKEFLCEDCGKTLSSLQSYLEHSNIHRNIKPYKCEECGHESRQLSVHSRHLMTHEKNSGYIFRCNICSKTFRLKEYLKQHMRKHVGEKPYICEQCKKSFTTKSELNRHSVCHSNDRPHTCHHCNRTFKLKHNLNAHIKAHTQKQSWKCCLCKASFPQQCMMEKHKKTHSEVVQHVELVKNDKSSLSITSLPLDRRKVLHYQNVSLPSDVDLSDSQNKRNAKVSLGLNDVFIPFSIIANSFGTGNYIKMKIVDRLNATDKNGAKRLLTSSGVANAVVVEKDKSNLEVETFTSSTEDEITDGHKTNCSFSNEQHKLKKNSSSPLKRKFFTHFESFGEVFNGENSEIDQEIDWICTFIEIIREFSVPFDYMISHCLHKVVSRLQNILMVTRIGSFADDGNLDLHAPSCDSCGPNESISETKTKDIYDTMTFENCSGIKEENNEDVSQKGMETGFKIQFISSSTKEKNNDYFKKVREVLRLYLILSELLHEHLKTTFLFSS